MERLGSTETYPASPPIDPDEEEFDFDNKDSRYDLVENKTGFRAPEQEYRHLTSMDIRDRVIGDEGTKYTRHRSRRTNVRDLYNSNIRHHKGFYGRLVFAIGLLAFTNLCSTYVYYQRAYLLRAPFFNDAPELLTPKTLPSKITPQQIRILFWSKRYGNKVQEGDIECPNRCHITVDKRKLNSSDALVFHMWDVKSPLKDLPAKRHSRTQKWIMYNLEPELHNMNKFNGIFNATMTYRQDSDIYVPYGYLKKYEKFYNIEINHALRKRKLAAWFVSSCHTKSLREDYMKELQRYMPVDIYGDCGELKCQVGSDGYKCLQMLDEDYKFYFSFENSLCEDFVTEKLWDMYRFNIIPVVLGNANYKAILPENSYIDIRNFTSPQELAAFIHMVANDNKLYNSYFNWQRNYEVVWVKRRDQRMCLLCDYLHATRGGEDKVHWDLGNWWDNKCMNTSSFYQGKAPIL